MTRTSTQQLTFTPQGANRLVRSFSPGQLAARVAVIVCAWLVFSSTALAQNVQFTQGGVGSGLDNTLSIPIASYPGRGATSLPVTLYYSSRVWRVAYKKTVRVNSALRNSVAEAVYAERSVAGWTTSLDVPQLEWPKAEDHYSYTGKPAHSFLSGFDYKVANLFVHMPDGSTHELRKQDEVYAVGGPTVDMGGDFYAVDSSRMRFHGAGDGTGTLYLADASCYKFEEGGDIKFVDRHGNTLHYHAAARQWTDTLGNLRGNLGMPLPASPQAGENSVYQPPGFSSPYVFKWRHLSEVLTPADPGQPTPQLRRASDYYLLNPGADPTDWNSTNFPQPVSGTGPAPLFFSGEPDGSDTPDFTYVVGRGQGANDLFDPVVLAEVVLPTSTENNVVSYKFTYNEYGEIDKIVYPTGGYERLKYGRVNSVGGMLEPYNEASRGVQTRRVGPMVTVTGEDAVWTYESLGTEVPNALLVGTTAPDGTYTESYRHNFNTSGNFGYQDARNGMTFDERVYSKKPSLGGVMLRRSLTQWTQSSFTYPGPVPAGQPLTSIPYTAYRNARPAGSVSLMLDTGGAALAKKVTYGYDASDPSQYMTIEKTAGLDRTLMTESLFAEIDPGTAATAPVGTILGYSFPASSSTQTVYLNDGAYRARNLLGLATSVTLKDAAGQPVSKTETFYDEADTYPLIPYGDLDDSYTDPASNARGNPTTVRRYVNPSATVAQGVECPAGVCLQTHAQFDGCGNPINFWDERGVLQSQKEYAADYRHAYLTKTTSAVPDPGGQHGSATAFTSLTTYEAATGLVLTTRDANDQETRFSYHVDATHRDPLNRLRIVTRPDESWTKTDYNDVAGNLYVHVETQLDDSRSTHSYQFYDQLGRPSRSLAPELGANYIVSATRYDLMGRASETSNPIRTTIQGTGGDPRYAAFWQTSAQPTLWSKTEYDELGRVRKVTRPDFAFVTTLYEGVYTTVTDQAGRQRRQKTDALGRIVRVDEPDLNGTLGDKNSPVQPSFYEYDALGNIARINQGLAPGATNPETTSSYVQHRSFRYDALSRLTYEKQVEQAGTINDPVTGQPFWSRQLTYDEMRDGVSYMGQLSKAEDARHVYSWFHYDKLGRNTRVDYSDGTPSVTSRYDESRPDDTHPAGEPAVVFKNNGRLTEVKTEQVATAEGWTIPQTRQLYDYDLMGRTRRQRQEVGANTYELRYGYNLGGGLVSERYPSGRVVTYAYDDAGRLQGVGSGATSYASGMTYRPFGGLEAMTLGNGAVYSMAYDEVRLQLAKISLKQGEETLQQYEYKYGAVNMATGAVDETKDTGQIARIESAVGAQKLWQQRFQYDTLGRLASAGEYYGNNFGAQSYLLNYDYDIYGNRYQQSSRNQNNPVAQQWVEFTNNQGYDATTNRFASGVTYDAAGNVIADTRFRQLKYEYDANNRQRRSARLDDTGAAHSVYDGAGQRVATVAAGSVTRVMVYDAASDLVAEYGGSASTNGTQYVMADQQGSTRLTMTSAPANGQLVAARQDYLPFGEELLGGVGPRAGVAGYDQSTDPRQKYAGMERDDSTGMSHTLWREFDALSARWTAPDPYGGSMEPASPQSFNRYTYVNNDPVNKVDPTGLMLSDIGVYQTDNAAVVWRLNWAMVTVLHRYMEGQTGQAQQQQRQQQRNNAFVSGMGRSVSLMGDVGNSGEGGDSGGGADTGGADSAGAGSASDDGFSFEPAGGASKLGYGRIVGQATRIVTPFDCQTKVNGVEVSRYMTAIVRDFTFAVIAYSPRMAASPLTSQTPEYGSRVGDDDRGHIIARALGGGPSPDNLFWQDRHRNRSEMKAFENGIRRTLTDHKSWRALVIVSLFYARPVVCVPQNMRPTGVLYQVYYQDGRGKDVRSATAITYIPN